MNVRGATLVIIEGPVDQQADALASLESAGIAAERSAFESGRIEAWFSDGTENPPPGYIEECVQRTTAALAGTGFTVDRAIRSEGSASSATMKWIIDTQSGELHGFVDTAWHSPVEIEQRLRQRAAAAGIPFDRLELRDPPWFDALLD